MNKFLIVVMLGAGLVSVDATQGATIYESGTLGRTEVAISELRNGSVAGSSVERLVFTGVRFHFTQPFNISEIGGHFVSGPNNSFFGAIVELDGVDDFPDSGDFSTPDFLGAALLTFPVSSDEVFGELSLSLDPGWYALVFGSGHFNAEGEGSAVRNGVDIGDPTYIGFQPNATASGWFNLNIFAPSFENHRFVIKGSVVPEPSCAALLLAPLFFLIKRNPCRHAT